MPDQGSAASEHALLREVTEPLSRLPENPLPPVADVEFPIVLRGYDRLAVDAYVKRTSQLVAELQATRSPEAAVRRALERVGEEVSGILQRAHDTAEQITAASRREAEERLEVARQEGQRILADGERRLRELDAETDRIWAERHQIVEDARFLASRLLELADEATDRFPAAEEEAASTEPDAEAENTVWDEAIAGDEAIAADDGPAGDDGTAGHDGTRGDEGFEAPQDEREGSIPPPPVAAGEGEDDLDATTVMPPIDPEQP